jgi:hypothetical protein
MSGSVDGWIWRENVERFLSLLSSYISYDFDLTDWETIETELKGTDNDRPDSWYTYPLIGSVGQLDIRLA